MPQKSGLGKGLDALLPESEEQHEVPIGDITPLAGQPRRSFPEKELMELAYSITVHGILQPLVVTPVGRSYQLIAGERRLRAAKLAGLKHVPVYVRSSQAQDHFELALIENLQRADLDPIEEAHAYQKLLNDSRITQDQLAKRLGKSRSKLANALRLLKLSSSIQAALQQGRITVGHATALLAHDEPDRTRLFTMITEHNLSVRQAESWQSHKPSAPRSTTKPDWLLSLQRELGVQIDWHGTSQRGRLVLHYHAPEELTGLVERLRKS